LWALLLFLFPWTVGGQPAAPSVAPPPNRFLFIVDTADEPQGQLDGVLKTVQDLFASGFGSQAQEGDSFRVWTFNEPVSANHFPLQRWSALHQRELSSHTLAYLRAQKAPQRRAAIEKVLPTMSRLINESAYITVILVSDGSETIHGTPFDHAINATYKKWRKAQQKAKLPFVTVLQAKNGQITGYSVTPAPWVVEMPALPPELRRRVPPPAPPVAKVPETTKPAAREVTTATKPPAPDNPPPSATTNPESSPPVPGVISSTVLPPDTPTPSNPPSSDSNTQATVAAPTTPATEIASSPAPPPKPEASPATIAQPAISIIPPPPPASQTTTPAKPPPSDALKPAPAAPAHLPAASATPVPAVAKPAPTAPPPSTPPRAAAAQESAATVPSPALFNRQELWIWAAVFLGALLGLVILLVRRSRSADHASLITRSLERQKQK
jgi:hypothetical protein